MTALRVGKVGPGEVLVLCWCLLELLNGRRVHIRGRHLTFWLLFLLLATAGTIWAGFINAKGSSSADLVTWVILGVAALVVSGGYSGSPPDRAIATLDKIAIVGGVIYGFLWAIGAAGIQAVGPVPLWYGGVRFSAGADNPHQVAILLGLILIIHTWRTVTAAGMARLLLHLGLASVSLAAALATDSSTLLAALTLTGVISLWLWLSAAIIRPVGRLALLLLGLAALLLASSWLWRAGEAFVEADPNGPNRIDLWTSFSRVFSQSPIVGLGPGIHAAAGTTEFHNTYLEVAAMAGTLGLVVFLIYFGALLRDATRFPLVCSLIVFLLAYGVAGFSMRRLVFWIILMVGMSLVGDSVAPAHIKGSNAGRVAQRSSPTAHDLAVRPSHNVR